MANTHESVATSEEDYSGSEESEVTIEKPPPIPAVIANWWLNENLGSGYSGMCSKSDRVAFQC
jgi:casein kinase 1